MNNEMLSSILSLHGKIDGAIDDIKEVKDSIHDMPCAVNQNRLGNLEKVVFGAVKLILVGFVVAVIALVANSGNEKAVADQGVKIIKVK